MTTPTRISPSLDFKESLQEAARASKQLTHIFSDMINNFEKDVEKATTNTTKSFTKRYNKFSGVIEAQQKRQLEFWTKNIDIIEKAAFKGQAASLKQLDLIHSNYYNKIKNAELFFEKAIRAGNERGTKHFNERIVQFQKEQKELQKVLKTSKELAEWRSKTPGERVKESGSKFWNQLTGGGMLQKFEALAGGAAFKAALFDSAKYERSVDMANLGLAEGLPWYKTLVGYKSESRKKADSLGYALGDQKLGRDIIEQSMQVTRNITPELGTSLKTVGQMQRMGLNVSSDKMMMLTQQIQNISQAGSNAAEAIESIGDSIFSVTSPILRQGVFDVVSDKLQRLGKGSEIFTKNLAIGASIFAQNMLASGISLNVINGQMREASQINLFKTGENKLAQFALMTGGYSSLMNLRKGNQQELIPIYQRILDQFGMRGAGNANEADLQRWDLFQNTLGLNEDQMEIFQKLASGKNVAPTSTVKKGALKSVWENLFTVNLSTKEENVLNYVKILSSDVKVIAALLAGKLAMDAFLPPGFFGGVLGKIGKATGISGVAGKLWTGVGGDKLLNKTQSIFEKIGSPTGKLGKYAGKLGKYGLPLAVAGLILGTEGMASAGTGESSLSDTLGSVTGTGFGIAGGMTLLGTTAMKGLGMSILKKVPSVAAAIGILSIGEILADNNSKLTSAEKSAQILKTTISTVVNTVGFGIPALVDSLAGTHLSTLGLDNKIDKGSGWYSNWAQNIMKETGPISPGTLAQNYAGKFQEAHLKISGNTTPLFQPKFGDLLLKNKDIFKHYGLTITHGFRSSEVDKMLAEKHKKNKNFKYDPNSAHKLGLKADVSGDIKTTETDKIQAIKEALEASGFDVIVELENSENGNVVFDLSQAKKIKTQSIQTMPEIKLSSDTINTLSQYPKAQYETMSKIQNLQEYGQCVQKIMNLSIEKQASWVQ